MPRTGRDEHMVAWPKDHPSAVRECELGFALEERDPLVAVLFQPLSDGGRLTARDDSLDEDLFVTCDPLEQLFVQRLARQRE